MSSQQEADVVRLGVLGPTSLWGNGGREGKKKRKEQGEEETEGKSREDGVLRTWACTQEKGKEEKR